MSFLLASVLAACGGEPDGVPPESQVQSAARPGDNGDAGTTQPDDPATSCVSFATRECTIDLGVVNGVHDCAKGTQVCENGAWSSCSVPNL